MRKEEREKVTPRIIHQDEFLLVIDKPSGWIVNDAATTTTQPVLQSWLKENFNYEIANSYELRSGIVHRLDKETSGVLLIAKTPESFHYLQNLFKERKIEKTYIALLHGKLKDESGVIEAEVGRLPWNRRRFGVLLGGRPSKTKFKLIDEFTKEKEIFSLVEFHPETGRTHQIRIHAKHIGHPIVGDEFYAGRKTARRDRLWCSRTFLHAQSIRFRYPSGNEVNYQSKLPNDLQEALDLLLALPE